MYKEFNDSGVGAPILQDRVRAAETGMRVAKNLERDHPGVTLINLRFSALEGDPVGTMRGLYEQLRWDWTTETREAIEERIVSSPRPPSRLRRYRADDVGLDDQEIETALGAYMNEYAEYLR